MAAITICSDFGAQKNKVCHCFHYFPSICHEVMGLDAMILVFWMLSFKPMFSLSSFTFIKRLFSSSLSAIRVVSSAYLRLLIFLLAILIPACASSSPAFLMVYSAYTSYSVQFSSVQSLSHVRLFGKCKSKPQRGASLVVQWWRIHPSVQWTPIESLVWEDSTCCGQLSPRTLEPVLHDKTSLCTAATSYLRREQSPFSTTRESSPTAIKTQRSQKKKAQQWDTTSHSLQ